MTLTDTLNRLYALEPLLQRKRMNFGMEESNNNLERQEEIDQLQMFTDAGKLINGTCSGCEVEYLKEFVESLAMPYIKFIV